MAVSQISCQIQGAAQDPIGQLWKSFWLIKKSLCILPCSHENNYVKVFKE